MYVPFEELPDNSKIWIYQSDREFTEVDLEFLNSELRKFTDTWSAHSQTLKTSFQIRYNYFIILSVDENINDASGCSVDSSVHVVKKIGEELNIDFFKRENLLFLNNEKVTCCAISELNQHIISNNINRQSIFFNNLAVSMGQLKSNWMVPAENTWLKKYFNIK